MFLRFKIFIKNQLNLKIKTIQSDNAKEFQVIDKFLMAAGFIHCYTCPHTHQQNGYIEGKHHYVVEIGLSLLMYVGFPLKYWI